MTYNEACKKLNRTPLKLSDFDFLPEDERVSAYGEHKLITCIKVLNAGWKPDWLNYNEIKWRLYFNAKKDKSNPTGVGFSFNATSYVRTGTVVGSRLCFKTRELAEQAAKDPDILQYYNEYLL